MDIRYIPGITDVHPMKMLGLSAFLLRVVAWSIMLITALIVLYKIAPGLDDVGLLNPLIWGIACYLLAKLAQYLQRFSESLRKRESMVSPIEAQEADD